MAEIPDETLHEILSAAVEEWNRGSADTRQMLRSARVAATHAYRAGVEAAAQRIEAHAESIGWYEGGGVWAEAIELARGEQP